MKNMMLKSMLCLILVLTLGVGLIGCSSKPKGDPTEVLNKFYENIKNNNIGDSYELLSEVTKSNWEKDDFLKLYEYTVETIPLKDYKVEKINEYKNKDIDGIQYKNAIEFEITETVHDAFDDKDVNHEYKRYVINDNGNWKIYIKQMNIKETIVIAMTELAGMYCFGKGEVKDPNKAVSILNEAVAISTDYSYSYYVLGSALKSLQRYDESIENIQEYLNKTDKDSDKSDAYNILGIDYQGKKDYAKAKEYYNQAIQLNDNNQYAKTNLDQLNKIIK